MKVTPPRHPIVIVGAGIAGLSAAATLRDMGLPYLVLERFGKPGGRMNTRSGEGWVADHGVPYFRLSDTALCDLIRSVGFEEHRVAIAGGVHRLTNRDQIVVPPNGGLDSNRLCIDIGFGSFIKVLAASLNVDYNRPVGAVRWDNDDKVFWWQKEGRVFWFEDEEGEPIRNPQTRDVLMGSGLILATTPTAALRIAQKSASLQDLVPALSKVETARSFTGLYRVPRIETPWYALQGDPGSLISWMGFEERKAPERVDPAYSLLLVQAGHAFSDELIGMREGAALATLYAAARRVLPRLPEYPSTQTYKKWNMAFPTSEPMGFPESGRWSTAPEEAPFALAGDYVLGNRAEDAVRSGIAAARMVASQLPARRSVLGLELHG
jgi:predicted NAD/FAD-dependent oxidoreductase